MRVRQSVYIHRPPDEVFLFVADRANDHLWRTELGSSAFVGPVTSGVGVHARQSVSYQGRSGELNIEVTDFDPGRRLCFRVHGGARAHGCCDVVPDGDGSRLEFTLTLELKGDQVMLERFLRQAIESVAAADLARLAGLLEGRAVPEAGA